MDSNILKTEALCWLRFGKKMSLVATEAGHWSADVIGVGEKFSVEVEVKVSKADLKREFTNKRAKHYLYANAADKIGPSRSVPNYFYFYVPEELAAEALAIIEVEAPKAGLAVYNSPVYTSGHSSPGKMTRIARRPAKLHDHAPTEAFKRTVLLRMGSELCGRYLAQQTYQTRVLELLHSGSELITNLVKQMHETPDADPTAE